MTLKEERVKGKQDKSYDIVWFGESVSQSVSRPSSLESCQ